MLASIYSNHVATINLEKIVKSQQNKESQKGKLSDVSNLKCATNELDLALLTVMLAPNYSSDSELMSEEFDREA